MNVLPLRTSFTQYGAAGPAVVVNWTLPAGAVRYWNSLPAVA